MSSHYISSLSNIRSRTLGPLNAQKAPNVTRVVNAGIVNGNPPQFHQEPLNANMNAISRYQNNRVNNNESNVKRTYKDTSSSDRIRRLKSQNIGMKSNSTKNVNPNDVRSATRRMRSSGYVVPPKVRKYINK